MHKDALDISLRSSGWPAGDPRLLSLLPLVYVAWSDSDLTAAEIEVIGRKVQGLDWPSESKRELLGRWLSPQRPPAPGELRALLTVIRELAGGLANPTQASLAELGVELAKLGGGGDADYWQRPEVCGALAEIEGALGVDPSEACRGLLVPDGRRPEVEPAEPTAAFAISGLTRLLRGAYRDVRNEVLELLCRPEFRYEYELDRGEYRQRVFEWCHELARNGFGALGYPREYGGRGDIGRFIAVFETLGHHDLSLAVKFGVQFGLFGGSINSLGTRRHHEKYLRAVGELELPGCYAMSELAHGSNVRDLETEARYDPDTQEFVIHTPTSRARKVYIGNAALHGRMATVFAQLEVNETRYGVHAFLVPLRDESGGVLPGVSITDGGPKLGLNGVDNGSITFDRVRVPRENLLNRFSDVSVDGVYHTSIPSDAKRFFTMLGTLVGGRISVAAAALSAAKSGLTIAIRYGARRRQFGPTGESEVPILDYRTHQRRLMPPLATAYALDFALKHLVRTYLARRVEGSREVEVEAAGLKAYATAYTVRTLQTCRETCGGAGYMAINRFADLKADTAVFTTFEGDNTVLLQLVAKALLTEYKHQFEELQFFGVLKHLSRQAARAIAELNPIVVRLSDESHLRDPDFQVGALRYREAQLLITAARRLKKRIDAGMDGFTAFNECQDHLVKLAYAHVESSILEQFVEMVDDVRDEALRSTLRVLSDLFALSRIEQDRGWFLEAGYLEGIKAKAIRKLVNRLCREVRLQALPLVDAFAIPDELIAAPIAMTGLQEEG